jgi:hypothetical protein
MDTEKQATNGQDNKPSDEKKPIVDQMTDLGPVDNLPNRILLLGDSPGDSQLIESQGD